MFENFTIADELYFDVSSSYFSDSGKLFMCGDGSFGQLGTGDNHSRNFPFEVAYFIAKHIEKLALGMRHSLVLLKGK